MELIKDEKIINPYCQCFYIFVPKLIVSVRQICVQDKHLIHTPLHIYMHRLLRATKSIFLFKFSIY